MRWFRWAELVDLGHGGLEQEVAHGERGGVDGREDHHGHARTPRRGVPGKVQGDVHPGPVADCDWLQVA